MDVDLDLLFQRFPDPLQSVHLAFFVPSQVGHCFFKYSSWPFLQYGLWQSCLPVPLHGLHGLGLLESAIVG